jgi:TonB family protein
MEAVNTPPLPVNGKTNYDNYLKRQIRRPESLAAGDSATVVISFTISTAGAIEAFKVVSSPGDDFSNEARRLVMEGPAWKPASKNGVIIDDVVRLTIIIK